MHHALDPLTQAVWQALIDLWPLWAVVLLPILVRLLLALRRRRRLQAAGIAEVDQMDGVSFERFLEQLFRRQGYAVERTRAVGDFGADLVLTRQGQRTIVQAKRYRKAVGVKAVQEVVAAQKMYHGNRSMVVTNSTFTRQAEQLARANGVELWDRTRLVDAILATRRRSQLDTTQAADELPTP